MLTEIATTLYSVVVDGRAIVTNIPSYTLAESAMYSLPEDQRARARIVPITSDGKTVLLG